MQRRTSVRTCGSPQRLQTEEHPEDPPRCESTTRWPRWGLLLLPTYFLLQRMKLVVEPSGATVLASIRKIADQVRGKRVGMIVTGGNTDLRWLCGPEDCRRRLA